MEKIKFYTKSSISSTPELKMVIDVSGNVGIGESNPTKALEVVGDISFNGDLYQNGTPFQGGTLVNEITDISLNNLNVHGDISANDASFNNVDISNVLNVSNQIIVGDEMDPATAFSNSNQIKIAASDAAPSDYFGRAVAISNKFAIVGSTYNDDYGPDTGSAYIFDVITGNQIHKLMPNDAASEDYFGYSVAISGNYAIVGAFGNDDNGSNSGSAYIFDVSSGNQLHKLTDSNGAANDIFGRSVAISDSYAIVGADADDDNGSNSGSVFIFDVSSGNQLYKLSASDAASDDRFGWSVAISGNYTIIGSYSDDDNGSNSGSAYIFDLTSGNQVHKLTASDATSSAQFGYSVAISGNYAIVGARLTNTSTGSAYIFNVTTGTQLHKITASDMAQQDQFGVSVSISGNYAIVGAFGNDDIGLNSGSAYIFNILSGNQLNKLTASDAGSGDNFGYSVAISGNYAIVGSPNNNGLEGTAYIFTGTSLFNALNVNGSCLFSGTVTSNGSLLTSDDRVKHNEQPVTNALSTISKLTPKHYFKTKNKLYYSSHNFILDASGNPLDNNHQSLILNKDYTIETGIIAQEIQTIPELDFVVHETIPLGVDYNSIHCTHIAATNELYKLVQTQQQEINNLKQENQTLTQQIQIIQQHLGI